MLDAILQPVFEIAFYYVGRLVIPIASLGRWHCDPLLSDVPKREKRWGGLFHYCGGFVYFTSEGTSVIGIVFGILAISLVIGICYGWR
ncbi:MAG TPA: hypothetical protein VMF08_01905 [Candidatus Sulfotelmatobacter sp.]|nr:hypothetical protein [Candidatus Sulfotelmatobacter sp.]